MHRRELLKLLDAHTTRFMEEAAYIARARNFVTEHEDCFRCDLWPGHVTGSAWVVNPRRDHALLLHHRKHDQWFQPGGHADGDADILRVALRETSEETGLSPSHIRLVDGAIFDVDIHTIPASERGPQHQHIDIRFLVEMDDDHPIPGNDESHQVLWVPLHQVARFNNNRSTHRMVEKTRQLRGRTDARASRSDWWDALRRDPEHPEHHVSITGISIESTLTGANKPRGIGATRTGTIGRNTKFPFFP